MSNADELIDLYVIVRDRIRDIEKRHKQELEKDKTDLLKLEGALMKTLDTLGVNSIKGKSGTAYITTQYTASLSDPEAFMQHVISTGQFELLNRAANKTAVKSYVEKNDGQTPPGCNLTSRMELGVRRPTEKTNGH